MKKLGILLSMLFIFACAESNNSSANDESGLKWYGTIEEAVQVASSENKQILVQFTGSDWCKWCIKLNNEVFYQDDFETYAKKNMVLVKLDFPRSVPQSDAVKEYNRSIATKYGVRGFPTILLMDKEGNVVLQTGYQPGGAKAYVDHIKEAYKAS